jgi:hypothetical protein
MVPPCRNLDNNFTHAIARDGGRQGGRAAEGEKNLLYVEVNHICMLSWRQPSHVDSEILGAK